jgi:hypothetical protein
MIRKLSRRIQEVVFAHYLTNRTAILQSVRLLFLVPVVRRFWFISVSVSLTPQNLVKFDV